MAHIVNPNVAIVSCRRVGCAHQIALNLTIEGGHSPPYTDSTGINQWCDPAILFRFRFDHVVKWIDELL